MAIWLVLVSFGEEFLYELKAGPAGGRLRQPSWRRLPTTAPGDSDPRDRGRQSSHLTTCQ